MAETEQPIADSGYAVNLSLVTSSCFIVSVIIIAVIMFIFFVTHCLTAYRYCDAIPGGSHLLAASASARRPSSGLDAASVKAIPCAVLRPEDLKVRAEECCAVCLCELAAGEAARLLPNCNHAFHSACIDMWFYTHTTCPVCRMPAAIHHRTEDVVSGNANEPPVEPQPEFLDSMSAGSSNSASRRSLDDSTVAQAQRGEAVHAPNPPLLVEEIMSALVPLRRIMRPGSRAGDASTVCDIEQGYVPKSSTSS